MKFFYHSKKLDGKYESATCKLTEIVKFEEYRLSRKQSISQKIEITYLYTMQSSCKNKITGGIFFAKGILIVSTCT